MSEFTLHQEFWLPRQRDEIFPFFADAKNPETITPPRLSFRILTPVPITMRSGTWIDYTLRLRGLPLRWQSEITVWDAPHRFVDEQRRRPYRFWSHEHRFEERNDGTLCVDHVRYAVSGGQLVERLFCPARFWKTFLPTGGTGCLNSLTENHRVEANARRPGTSWGLFGARPSELQPVPRPTNVRQLTDPRSAFRSRLPR